MKELIGFVGISPDRLRLEWISGSEGAKFANLMDEFTRQIRELGPLPLGKRQEKILRHKEEIA